MSGAELPIHIVGSQDPANLNPYSFASALPHLIIAWTLAGQEDTSLEGSWAGVGVSLQPTTNGGVAVLRAGSPGKAVVSVRVRISQSIAAKGQYQVRRAYASHHQCCGVGTFWSEPV